MLYVPPFPITTATGKKNVEVPTSNPLGRNLASNFTSSGCDMFLKYWSIGRLLACVPKYVCHKLLIIPGNAIQEGNDSRADTWEGWARFWAGASLKGLGYIGEAVSELVGGAVDVGVATIKNLGETALRIAAYTALKSASYLCYIPDNAEYLEHINPSDAANRPSCDERSNILSKMADDIITPTFIQNIQQTELSPKRAKTIKPYARLLRCTQSNDKLNKPQLPVGYTHAQKTNIPPSILARRNNEPTNTGEKLTLRIDQPTGQDVLLLRSDEWSALRVGVFKAPDGKIVLCFDGTALSRIGTIKSDVCSTLGIYDSAHRDGKKLVKAFVEQYGADNVIVAGHSLGGNIASFAAMSNSKGGNVVKAICFNSMGMHIALRNKLGSKMAAAYEKNVIHINAAGDYLIQLYTRITASVPVGYSYLIPESKKVGHGLKKVVERLDEITDKLIQKTDKVLPTKTPTVGPSKKDQ